MMTDVAESKRTTPDVDVVVVGAGIAGLYLAYRLSRAGYRLRVFESADDLELSGRADPARPLIKNAFI